ncbi:NHS-like protein 1 isoform X3 [Lates japonicus]|uniref:NHS-like protein 1 isoform X3 n=1 Tax=Lates japonicus TaxID=270547 RepID=A0AAD3N9V1_LATJO|nr:NHS-like protein 1 isoform X3 [Lates japonicus]
MVLIGAAIKSVLKYLNKTRAGDRDSKWSVHYTTQKPQQGLVFIPGKRRSGSADDLQGPLYFNPKCRKHFNRLYHNTRDCTVPAYYKRCARLLTQLANSPRCAER